LLDSTPAAGPPARAFHHARTEIRLTFDLLIARITAREVQTQV
jgi:hypothetical protein